MSSIGEKLRGARLAQGLTIAELATRTKVGAKFLESIEADRRDELPAGFFFKNWTLQYARALSLNEKQIQDEIDRILRTDAPLPLPGQDQPLSKGWARVHPIVRRRESAPRLLLSFVLLFLVVLACSGFYAWWHNELPGRLVPAAWISEPAAVASNTPVSPAVTEPTASAVVMSSSALLLEIFAKE